VPLSRTLSEATMRALIAVLICAAAMAVVVSAAPQNSTWRPVVLMHGLFASNEAMSHAQQWMKKISRTAAPQHTHTHHITHASDFLPHCAFVD